MPVVFSSRLEGIWVAEGPNLDWREHLPLLTTVVGAAAGALYATFLPWWPGGHKKFDAFKDRYPDSVPTAQGLIAGRVPDGDIGGVLDLRDRLGGAGSGLWSCGTTTSFDDLVRLWRLAEHDGDSPTLGTVAAITAIEFALCLDDGLDVVFLRLSGRTASIPELFVRSTHALGSNRVHGP